MFQQSQQKIKRLSVLVSILSKYGFNEVLFKMNLKSDVPPTDSATAPVYVRIRKVLEDLGPTFIKLGQAFSNREDILPKALTEELQHLQDHTKFADISIYQVLEDNFGDVSEYFAEISTQPLASASIAQVYRANLKDGEKVILKVKRPGIEETIKGDLLLLRDLQKILSTYFEFADILNLEEAVNTFEKSLLQELSLNNERENIERFAAQFKNDQRTHVPDLYPYFCNNDVLCMEFIEGAKSTDFTFIEKHHLNPSKIAETGLQLYLTQIMEHGFFHADPHAGNIMITQEGKIVFIDLGSMGTLYAKDQELIEDLVVNLILRNPQQLVSILKKMAIRIDVKDEKKLQDDIQEILTMVDSSSLENLKIENVIRKFKEILFENKVIMPNYFTLLARGIGLIESVGRTLDPNMNLVKSVEPYIYKIMAQRLNPKYILGKSFKKMGALGNDLHNVPIELRNVLQQIHSGKLTVKSTIPEFEKTNQVIKSSTKDLILGMILAANMVATSIVFLAEKGPMLAEIPLFSIFGFLLSVILAVILLLRTLRR